MKTNMLRFATFDRFDVVEAWYVWLCLHHCGVVHDPPRSHPDWWQSYNRLSFMESTLHFKPGAGLDVETLSENGREIYDDLCRRAECCDCLGKSEEPMGSISRMSRCSRFRKQLEDKVVAKSPFQMGDWVEVVGVSVGQSEDGTEVSKLYITFRNKRTGDEDSLTFDECLYDPEDVDENNIDRLHGQLYGYAKDDEDLDEHRNEVIDLLVAAELISPEHKEKP